MLLKSCRSVDEKCTPETGTPAPVVCFLPLPPPPFPPIPTHRVFLWGIFLAGDSMDEKKSDNVLSYIERDKLSKLENGAPSPAKAAQVQMQVKPA